MSDVAKLGQIHDEPQGRDAVHVAVAPVVAAQILAPGDHVGLVPGSNEEVMQPNDTVTAIGIVDPFIRQRFVAVGDRFFVFLYPQTITGLRHVWTHPAFAIEGGPVLAVPAPVKSAAQAWMETFAGNYGYTAERMLRAGDAWIEDQDYLCDGGTFEGEWVPDEFWDHYEALRGRKVDPSKKGSFFTCSC